MIPAVLEATQAKNSFELDRDHRDPHSQRSARLLAPVVNLIAQAHEKKDPG